MIPKSKSPLIILTLSLLFAFISAGEPDIVVNLYSVSTVPEDTSDKYKSVSMEGGALLYIKGSGFSTKSALSNKVKLGVNLDCPVIEFMTTSTQIVCEVPPYHEAKTFDVKVIVDEEDRVGTAPNCWITYSYANTPILHYMLPSAGSPGDEIEIYGKQRVNAKSYVDYVKIGDYLCETDDENELNGQTFNVNTSVRIPYLVPDMEAGYYPVSQKNKLNTGYVWKSNSVSTYKFGGEPYDFAVVPKINSISSHKGSPEGQIISIQGAGFSTTEQNEVKVGDTSCEIISQSSNSIQCEIQPTTSQPAIRGYHAGLKYEMFKGKTMDEVRTANPPLTPDVKAPRLGAEIPQTDQDTYASRLSGYFKAPTSGTYKFVVSANDLAQLYISETPLEKTNLKKIAEITRYVSYKFFKPFIGGAQNSGEVTLTAGNYYYMELYHYDGAGDEHASIGVQIPNAQNQVNNVPEIQSIKLNCPTNSEVLEFRLSNVNGGQWKIRFDYLSADGKKIEKTSTTTAMSYNEGNSTVYSSIFKATDLNNRVIKKMLKADGTETTDSAQAITFVYEVTFLSTRNNGVLPVIISSALTGTQVAAKVTKLQSASAPLQGTWSISRGGSTADVPYNVIPDELGNKLRSIGYKDPINIHQSGEYELGTEYRIQFTGEGAGPVDPLIISHSLTGCANQAGISVTVTTLQDSSTDLFYETIPADLLFSADEVPQVTVKSNGIVGSCPGFNCDYEIQTSNIPEVTAMTYDAPTLTLSIGSVSTNAYSASGLEVFFGNTKCSVTSYVDSSIPANLTASCPAPEAGTYFPKVHFPDIGYAKIGSGLTKATVNFVVSSTAPSQVNPNGGTKLTVAGTGFPASPLIAQKRGMTVNIGSVPCVATSVTPTQIKCTAGAVSSGAALIVALNGVTAQTSSSIALMDASAIPTINSITPSSVNPVLQTDITISGSSFDANIAQTKIVLQSSTTGAQVAECLPISSTATQITCKLLGAPSGAHKLQVETSQGLTNSVNLQVKTSITSVSPSSGSAAGGTVLTIQGGIFSEVEQQSQVFIGDNNVLCDVISSTANKIECRTQPKYLTYGNGSPQSVVVTTRLVEEAVCDATGGNTCTFAYSDSLTPTVTALSATSVTPGSSLQITGTGFQSIPAGTTPTVTINGVDCSVTSSTDTQITVTIPDSVVPTKSAELIVNIAGKGNAKFSSVSSTIQVPPMISSLTPSTGSTAGVLVTLTGAGFQDGVIVKVGGVVCDIRSRSSTSITCKATASGDASVSYLSFTNIKCANTAACRLTTSTSQTPTLTSVSPKTPTSASAFTLTIVGTQLDLATTVSLVSKADNTIIFTGQVTSKTATQVIASFTNVAAGDYSIEVACGTNIASTTTSIAVTVPLTASVSSSVVSSIAGGATLTVSGSGFFDNAQKDKNKVTVCGSPCKVTQSTPTSIECQTPAFVNAAVKTTYPSLVTPSILQGTFSSDAGTHDNVLDNLFTTAYVSTKLTCTIKLDVGIGLVGELSEVKYYPSPSITASTLASTIIEGSNDDVSYTEIFRIDANVHDGWNTFKPEDSASPIRYRFYRLRGVNGAKAYCAVAELQFYGVTLSSNQATDLNALDCTAKVIVNEKSQETTAGSVQYRQSQTASLTTISPNMGTTAGGTTVTLTGTGFETDAGKINVLIDDIECVVTGVPTTTEIKCITGAAPDISNRRPSLQSELKIHFAGRGYVAVNSLKYFYVDRWSSENTWGGITPPREGDSVHIPAGQTILLDISPPKLKAIVIEGALIFEDTDLNLHCEYIMIRGGRMQIGTWENPIQSKVTVTIYGNKESAQLPTFGNKVIAMMEGILDIHGKKRSHTWTVLDTTAEGGATSIVVQGDVDWAAGEQIVIASTDHDHYQSESRTINTVTKNSGLATITFTEPLKYKHYAKKQTIDGVEFDMRAEVGLLTRNVVIQGDESSEKLKYGVHIMSHSSTGDDSSIGRISYTEVRQAGQAFNLGRYPIHFHLIGNVRQSYVIGNSIHHTYNRAVTIHGVHYLKVQKNVAYWVMGHTIFIEDGIETHNLIEDNLVINTMASSALLNTDQTPASFWITNPNNIWRRNHAAGSDRYGFWFDLRKNPEGPSFTPTICPTGERLGEFTDNHAHSNGRYGLRIFHELIPRTYPCRNYEPDYKNPPIEAVFSNFLGWKNRRSAVIGERLGAIRFKNIKTADNLRAGIEISDGGRSPDQTLIVDGAWIAGVTPDNAGDTNLYVANGIRGLITPKVDNFLAKNVRFYHFGFNMTAIETCSHCEGKLSTDAGARTSTFEGLSFKNVDQKVRFNIPWKEILVDKDGTLTGNNGGGVVTYFYNHLDVPGCVRNELVYNGLVCDKTVTIRKVEFYSITPFESFEMQPVNFLRVEDNPTGVIGAIEYREMNKKSWAVPVVMGYTYKVNWVNRADFSEVRIHPSSVITPTDKAVTLVFNSSEYREVYKVNRLNTSTGATVNVANTTTLWDRAGASLLNCADWYHDPVQQELSMVINGVEKQDIKVQAVKCDVGCLAPGQNVTKEGFVRLWSNATQWPNGQVPKHGDDVKIPGEWTIKLDISTANLSLLHIAGDLYFDGTKDNLVLTAQRIWVEGKMFVGNSTTDRFTKNAKILLTGNRNSETLMLGPVQDASNKVLAVTGDLVMYGAMVNTVYVRLQESAAKGATSITVPSTVDWKVGDEILIVTSQRTYNESEVRKITGISSGVITFNEPLGFYHYGAAQVTKETAYGTLDMRTEVGLLTRNIIIEGTDEGDKWGGRVYVGEIYGVETDYYYRGQVDLDGVEMRNLGQSDNINAGLTFDRLTSANNGYSTVKKCVMRNTDGYMLRIVGSKGVTVTDNIFYKGVKYQIRFEDASDNIKFSKNLVIGTASRGLRAQAGDMATDLIASLYADSAFTNSEISENIIAGCEEHCIAAKGGDCTKPEVPYAFKNNVVHSGEFGWIVLPANDDCTGVTGFTAYKMDLGLTSFFKTEQIQATRLIISDNKIGTSTNTGGHGGNIVFTYKDSYFGGLSINDPAAYYNKAECSNMKGIYIPVALTTAKNFPPPFTFLPWNTVKSDSIFGSKFKLSGITFENFKDNLIPGCTTQFMIQSNKAAADNSATTEVSDLTLINVGNENKIKFNMADDDWLNLEDCGGWYCTGIQNVFIRDTDGTLVGQPGQQFSLMPVNPTILDQSTCTVSEKQNAYICSQPGWGVLTVESMDIDVRTRLISPVYITGSSGYYNKINSYMDHVWDGFYAGLMRRSRFHAVAQSGGDYSYNFTGTVPNGLRWQLQGTADTDYVSAEYGYTNPQAVKVTFKNGTVIQPRVIKVAADKKINSTDPCGTNIYDLDTRRVTVKITGEQDCLIEAQLTNSIKGSIRYDIDVDEFFRTDGPATFIDKVALILGINPASIRIVEVRKGSTILYFFVDSTFQENTVESSAAAKQQLDGYVSLLTGAKTNGDLKVLGASILDSSFDLILAPIVTVETNTNTGGGTQNPEVIIEESSRDITIIIVAVVVAIVALGIGGFFAYKRYKRQKTFPNQIDMSSKVSKVRIHPATSGSPVHTENPLANGGSIVDLSPSRFSDHTLSPFKFGTAESPGRNIPDMSLQNHGETL